MLGGGKAGAEFGRWGTLQPDEGEGKAFLCTVFVNDSKLPTIVAGT